MREKLIDLVGDQADFLTWEIIEDIADHLIANGVTVGDKWVSTAEQLPNEGEMVIVHSSGEVGEAFLAYNDFHWANGFQIEKEVTHWMPLPEAPKGE